MRNEMSLYSIVNREFPQIFEFVFSKFLNAQIKNDFTPNKYRFFEDVEAIKNWGSTYADYFDLKKEESFKSNPNEHNLLPYTVFKWYSGYTYLNINQYLRGFYVKCDASYATDRIKVMEEEINQFRLEENIIVIRKISNDFLNDYLLKNKKIKKGTVLNDKAFLSTSLDLSYRKTLDGDYKPLNNETIIILKVAKNINAIYLEHVSKREEYELLLPNNLDIMIEKKVRILNNRILLAKVIPKELECK